MEFSDGFMALTGETGAGKSIVVDAMNLALGERAARELVRTGTEKAQVEALFDVSENPGAQRVAEELGIDCEDGQIIINRELSLSGKNVCRVNGGLQPLASLRKLTMTMVDLHGQHEHQSLLDDTHHGGFLDAYGSKAAQDARAKVSNAYEAYQEAKRQLRSLSGDARERAHRLDMLSFQVKEIDQAKLRVGEEEELDALRERLRNQEKILRALSQAHGLLSGMDEFPGASGALTQSARALGGITEYDAAYQKFYEQLNEAFYLVEDVAHELSSLLEDEEQDRSMDLDRIEQRLDDIRSLKHKYGDSIEEILTFRDKAEEDHENLAGSEERAQALEKEIAGLEGELRIQCAALSKLRKQLAKEYAAQVLGHIRDLGMGNAQFEVQVDPPKQGEEAAAYTPNGYDQIKFLFSANAGEPVKDLARIASGGEMSRVMLALKNVSADTDTVGCLIFDEIDTGISGRMAQVVGEKIARIAHGRQVICVTHLPQIACMADVQYVVEKQDKDGRAQTLVRRLDEQGRIEEVARLVGGSQSGVEHARSMLKEAESLRKKLRSKKSS